MKQERRRLIFFPRDNTWHIDGKIKFKTYDQPINPLTQYPIILKKKHLLFPPSLPLARMMCELCDALGGGGEEKASQ